jgi:two-component system sensor histidine kinase ChiS
MTVLFSDIRSFTSLSEGMSPRENFNFINAYLGRMSPIVKAHGGFVDKYIGDAVMALFPNSPDDALAAAVEMQREIGRYNERRRAQGFRAIQVGIGLHHGRLMLGTIGAEERMEGTVISDAVNLASRIEDLSREYGSGILLSDAALARLTDPSRYRMRLVDRVQVKGKRNAVSVYEALEGLPEDVIALRLATRGDFEAGVIAFVSGDEAGAERFMLRVLAAAPDDPAALYYLRRSTHQSRTAS